MVGCPDSIRGKQSVHFSALPVRWLKYTFLYGQPDTQNRQPRQRSWSTRTMPSSSRLYIAPDGHEATQDGFRQCSQIRGRYNMKTCSNASFTVSSSPARSGSPTACAGPPARSSSQLLPHVMRMSRPVSAEMEWALGFGVPGGASMRVW